MAMFRFGTKKYLLKGLIKRFFFYSIFSIIVALLQLKQGVQIASSDTAEAPMPVESDDFDPVDYLPAGLPPSRNDPGVDHKS